MWEHKIIELKRDLYAGEVERELDVAGAEGWELVAITKDPSHSEYLRYYLKRKKVV
jgi:hypothetical protein